MTEDVYPHRILRWEDGVPYWQLQAHADEVYRRELGIP